MNPVLRKDILGLLRLKRVAVIQICFVAVLALVVLGTWPQGGVVGGTVAIAAGSAHGSVADSLMMSLVLGQLVLLVLLVPGIAAVAITSEREAGTLEMLYATRLSAMQIVTGKIGLAIAYPLLLLISGLPFVALMAWRGELRADQLALSYGVLTLAALYMTILSLGISAMCQQGATALVVAYLVILVTCGGVLVPGAIMLDGATGELAAVLHYIRGLSPIAAALSVLKPRLNDFGGADRGMMPLWQVFLPIASVLSLVSLVFVAAKMRKAPSRMEGFGAPKSGTDAKRSWFRRLMFLIDPAAQRKPLGRGNPVIGKERRASNMRSGSWMIRIFYVSLFLSLALAVMALYGGTEHSDLMHYVVQVLIALQIALVTLVVPSLSTGSISGEMENDTFELLRLTPLSAGRIFWGKLVPSFVPAILPMIALLPAYAALTFIDPKYLAYLMQIGPVVLLAVLTMCILGLACSAFAVNSARATVAAYLIASVLVVGPMLVWWAGEAQLLSMASAKWAAMISPMVMSMNLLPNSRLEIAALRPYHLATMGGLCLVLLLAARARLASLLRHG